MCSYGVGQSSLAARCRLSPRRRPVRARVALQAYSPRTCAEHPLETPSGSPGRGSLVHPHPPARRLNSRQRRSKRRLEEFLKKKRLLNSKASEVVVKPIDEQLNVNPAGRNSTSTSTSARNCPVGELDERTSPSLNAPPASGILPKDRRQASETQRMKDSQASAITAAGSLPDTERKLTCPNILFRVLRQFRP